MRTITYRELRDALLEVLVEHGPDTLYESPEPSGQCVYVTAEGEPSCIFGHAFARLGIDITTLRGATQSPGSLYAVLGVGILLADAEGHADTPLKVAAAECQRRQDRGYTWEHAVQTFIDTYEKEQARGL